MYQIITSVNGIGFVTASYILVTTNEFININNPKKYACYSGVVPFEHSSGSSVRGKTRVSQMANKTHQNITSYVSIINNPNTRRFTRILCIVKIAEGKNKMSVIKCYKKQTHVKNLCLCKPK